MEMSLPELTNDIRRLFGVTDAKCAARVTFHSRNASVCYRCGRSFAAGDVMYRTRVGHPGFGGAWGYRLEPLCEGCAPRNCRYQHPTSCASCGRQVAIQIDWVQRKRVTCSDECKNRADTLARVAARASSEAARRQKVCIVCGDSFTATRADAKTCSLACKQKHYRRRLLGGKS